MRNFGRNLTWIAAILGAVGFLLYLFVVDTWVVPEDEPLIMMSIRPTLFAGDRILIMRRGTPRYGQLARCPAPGDPGKWVIGRVFGVEGDNVQIKRELVTVSGNAVSPRHGCGTVDIVHPATGQTISLSCGVEDNGAWTYGALRSVEFPEGERTAYVEPGHLYLVSDNRHLHWDSRDFGSIEAEGCQHVIFRLWGDTFTDTSRRSTILW